MAEIFFGGFVGIHQFIVGRSLLLYRDTLFESVRVVFTD